MGQIVQLSEAREGRRRREAAGLNARCRQIVIDSMAVWQARCLGAAVEERCVCAARVAVLGDVLEALEALGVAGHAG